MDDGTPRKVPGLEEEALFAHAGALLRYAAARVRDSHTAEDLVQETLVAAIGKVGEYGAQSSVRTWLLGILRHKLLDHYRWQQRHPGDQPEARLEDDAPTEDPWFTEQGVWREDPNAGLEALDLDPSRAVERSQLRLALKHCVDHLPVRLRRVFVLRELEELEPEAVCAAASISRDSLAVFLYRARQSLRTCLQKKWVEA
jgi:RNA polymerase sigma-70 factor (ECF subfamily)